MQREAYEAMPTGRDAHSENAVYTGHEFSVS
jgi:hypothetical protein